MKVVFQVMHHAAVWPCVKIYIALVFKIIKLITVR